MPRNHDAGTTAPASPVERGGSDRFCGARNTRAYALEQAPSASAQYCVRGGRACPCARLPLLAVARGVCRREGVRGREDSLGGRTIPLPLSMGNRSADRRHGLAVAAAGLRASAGECGAGDLPGRLEGERVRADTGSQCQNDAGRCGTQECPVCRGAAGTPCGARRAHAAITYGTSLPLQRDGLDGASSRSPSRQDGTDGPRFDRVE